MQLAQGCYKWRALALTVSKLSVMLGLRGSKLILRWILGIQTTRMGGGLNWLKIVSDGEFWCMGGVEP
jgi:hypothetical protein